MKLNDRNSAVRFLLDGDPVRYQSASTNDSTAFINREFTNMKPLFRHKIQYVCRSFENAFHQKGNKLIEVIRKEPIKQSGTMITPVTESGNLTIFYNIDSKPGGVGEKWILDGCIISFATKKGLGLPYLFYCKQFVNGFERDYFVNEYAMEGNAVNHRNHIIGLILFSNFCEIETKIIPAGKKGMHKDEKYVNDTELPIEILDSTWFTTIIRSEGFTVGGETGGFFRWQRFGPELSQKKIIWVDSFQKNGYTRKAKVLTKNKG